MLSDDEIAERIREYDARFQFACAGLMGAFAYTAKVVKESIRHLDDLAHTVEAQADRLPDDKRARCETLRACGVPILDALAAVESDASDDDVAALLNDSAMDSE